MAFFKALVIYFPFQKALDWGKEHMVLRAGVLRIRSAPKGSDLAVLYIFAVGTEVTLLANCKLKMLGPWLIFVSWGKRLGKIGHSAKYVGFRFLCFLTLTLFIWGRFCKSLTKYFRWVENDWSTIEQIMEQMILEESFLFFPLKFFISHNSDQLICLLRITCRVPHAQEHLGSRIHP